MAERFQKRNGRVLVYRSIWEKVTFIRQFVRKDGRTLTRTIFFPQEHPGHYDAIREFVGNQPITVEYGGANKMLGYRLKHELKEPFTVA